MSLTISRSEGVTVYTVASNHKSKWPLFCQILGTMCYSPVCSVSQRLKQRLGCTLTALATIQIMVGIVNLGFGVVTSGIHSWFLYDAPYWLGGMFLAVGIMCILSKTFPSQCLVVLTVMMNLVSAGLAVTAVVLYSMELWRSQNNGTLRCQKPEEEQNRYGRYYWTTPSPAKKAMLDEIYQKKLEDYHACQDNKLILQYIYSSLSIMMIVLAALQLCVTISWTVLNIKALCKKEADGQEEEDPELCKPLMEEETPNPVC